jgi:glyoxylase I family protein
MRISGFHHLALFASDVEGVAGFYREVFGLTEQARHLTPEGALRSIWLTLPEGAFLAVEHVSPTAVAGQRGWGVLALRIDRADRAAVLAELAHRGVPVESQSRWSVYFRDPEDNRVALSHHPFDPL